MNPICDYGHLVATGCFDSVGKQLGSHFKHTSMKYFCSLAEISTLMRARNGDREYRKSSLDRAIEKYGS